MSIVKHESIKTENRSRKRVGECRKGLLLLPFIGGLFLLWYVLHATVDVVYSDYIRIINSYLPDTLDPNEVRALTVWYENNDFALNLLAVEAL